MNLGRTNYMGKKHKDKIEGLQTLRPFTGGSQNWNDFEREVHRMLLKLVEHTMQRNICSMLPLPILRGRYCEISNFSFLYISSRCLPIRLRDIKVAMSHVSRLVFLMIKWASLNRFRSNDYFLSSRNTTSPNTSSE